MKTVKISKKKPPKWILDAVKEKWGVEWNDGIIFTYGDQISNSIGRMSADLLVHEMHHTIQQRNYADFDGPDKWWKRYLEDDQFRYEQELECYRLQHKWLKEVNKNKQETWMFTRHYANCLSGPMYGNLVSFDEAIEAIIK